MKNNVYRIILLVFVSCLIFLMLFSFVFSNKRLVSSITSSVNNVVVKVDQAVSIPFTLISNVQELISDLMSTYAENAMLKRSISDLENQSILISNLQDENTSLKAALNISENFNTEKVITAGVSSRSLVSWLNVLSVNVGINEGVSQSMLAISNGGVVGLVSDVSSSSATISLLSDSEGDNKLAATVSSRSDTSVYGIITNYNEDTNQLVMSQLNSEDEIEVGSEVVTSGLDSISVKNVPIGTVDEVVTNDGERRILIKPYANFDDISYVTLIGNGK